jgi:antitoxin YefM
MTELDRILSPANLPSGMKTVNYTEARNGLAALMRQAEEDREVIAITRNGHSSVVLMLQEEYDSLMETLHLLSTPANAHRIQAGLADYRDGKQTEHELCD